MTAMPISKSLQEKLRHLCEQKEKTLNITILHIMCDRDFQHAHILAKRLSNNSFIVWTSGNTGKEQISYENFYNGKYDMNLLEGLEELFRRAGGRSEVLYQHLACFNEKPRYEQIEL